MPKKGRLWLALMTGASILAGGAGLSTTVQAQGISTSPRALASRVNGGLRADGASSSVTLLESGSTLLYPLFLEWIPRYEKSHAGVTITPAGTGSGTGIAEALAGTVQIGASDAYMSNAQMKPGIENIPLAISAQVIAYNLPGLNGRHLHLSGPILARIYSGQIKYWDSKPIVQANPGVKLPNHRIIPIRRADSSGDSFLFTSYLTDSALSDWSYGYSTSPSWPSVSNEMSATGNGGMVNALKATPYSLAYVGISYLNQLRGDRLGWGALQNRDGIYVLPTARSIASAASQMVPKTQSGERISLIYAPGKNAYPIINYEYAIVNDHQPSRATAAALSTLLKWAINSKDGNSGQYLKPVHFQPLPASIVQLDMAQINKIH